MAFRLFRKRQLEPAVPAVEPMPVGPTIVADAADASDSDSAKEILELLELELGAMIRQLERAASSVAGDAEATATTLSTIRQRTNALTGLMREIDVPIRVNGRHWGGFRTAYKL